MYKNIKSNVVCYSEVKGKIDFEDTTLLVVNRKKVSEEFTESIKGGMIETPMIQEKDDGMYRVVVGWRRLKALEAADLDSVHVKVIEKDADTESLKWTALQSNIHWEQLPVLTLGEYVMKSVDKIGAEETAKFFCKGAPWVTKYSKVPTLPQEIKNVANELGIEIAYNLGRIAKVLHGVPPKDILAAYQASTVTSKELEGIAGKLKKLGLLADLDQFNAMLSTCDGHPDNKTEKTCPKINLREVPKNNTETKKTESEIKKNSKDVSDQNADTETDFNGKIEYEHGKHSKIQLNDVKLNDVKLKEAIIISAEFQDKIGSEKVTELVMVIARKIREKLYTSLIAEVENEVFVTKNETGAAGVLDNLDLDEHLEIKGVGGN